MTYELVVDEGDGEELVATGTRAQMEWDMDDLLASYQPGGECETLSAPPYRVQLAA